MTVVSTVIHRKCTAHACDSLVTKTNPDGTLEPIEWQKPKIFRVEKWRGAISYWGLSIYGTWNTAEWLSDRAKNVAGFESAEAFGHSLAKDLQNETGRFPVRRQRDRGLGLHFTAYEFVEGSWIPELFLISNWMDIHDTALRPDGFGCTRESCKTAMETESQDRLPQDVIGQR